MDDTDQDRLGEVPGPVCQGNGQQGPRLYPAGEQNPQAVHRKVLDPGWPKVLDHRRDELAHRIRAHREALRCATLSALSHWLSPVFRLPVGGATGAALKPTA